MITLTNSLFRAKRESKQNHKKVLSICQDSGPNDHRLIFSSPYGVRTPWRSEQRLLWFLFFRQLSYRLWKGIY
ncbi:hypothetical protein V6N13_146805 [Hibiscus sabdariffa]